MTSFVERSDSIDTIDNELDWLIQKDEEEALNAGKQVGQIWQPLSLYSFFFKIVKVETCHRQSLL